MSPSVSSPSASAAPAPAPAAAAAAPPFSPPYSPPSRSPSPSPEFEDLLWEAMKAAPPQPSESTSPPVVLRSPSSSPSPSSDHLGVWSGPDYRPYPADTTIPLCRLARDEVREEQRERYKEVRKYKRQREVGLCVEVLERRFREDVDDYQDGLPLTSDETRENRCRVGRRKPTIKIRPIWAERAREMRQFFDKVDLEKAESKRRLLSASSHPVSTPDSPGAAGESVTTAGVSPKKRRREEEEDDDKKEVDAAPKRRAISSPRWPSGTVKIPGLFLLDN